jgi:hypothetical protein
MSRTSFRIIQIAAAVGAVVVGTALAPAANADPGRSPGPGPGSTTGGSRVQESCVGLGGTTNVCQSPGNAQVYDAPPQVDYFPYAGGAT